MSAPDLHPAAAPLGGLLGIWRGRGEGHYPTIQTFAYTEEVTFGHVGKPFLTYTQRTRRVGPDGEPADPLHAETGYLRLAGPVDQDGDSHASEWMIAQPTGVVEVSEGTWAGGVLDVRAEIVTSSTAKRVDAIRRRYELNGDVLRYDVWMAAVGEPETHHLRAELHRT